MIVGERRRTRKVNRVPKLQYLRYFSGCWRTSASVGEWQNGGEGGIRTLGTRESTTVFETAPFDHSGTSPKSLKNTKFSEARRVRQDTARYVETFYGPGTPLIITKSALSTASYHRRWRGPIHSGGGMVPGGLQGCRLGWLRRGYAVRVFPAVSRAFPPLT